MSVNLLKTDTQDVFDINRWSTVNATAQTVSGMGERETVLGSDIYTDGIDVTSLAAGDVELRSPIFPIPIDKSFIATGIMKVGSTLLGEVLSMRVEYFAVDDVSSGAVLGYTGEKGDGAAWVVSTDVHKVQTTVSTNDLVSGQLATIPFSITAYETGFQYGNPVSGRERFWVPTDANYARIIFEAESVDSANLSFAISDVTAVSVSGVFTNKTFSDTYNLLPDFIRSSDTDQHNPTVGHHNLTRKLLASAFVYGSLIGQEIGKWGYTRAEDSLTNTEALSTLTNPLTAPKRYLSWLSQLLGVKLTNPFTGTSMWLSLAGWNDDTDSTTWQNLDVLEAESAEDSVTWQLARSSTYENIDAYRQQIKYAFNGLNAGKPEAMRSYLKTVLDTTTPDNYFTRIKTHYRESPFFVKYVFDPVVDPDPDGTRVETEMAPTLSAGVVGSQSNSPSDAAEFAFEAKIILQKCVPGAGVAANDDTVLRFGNDACTAIPDRTGSGRHISLLSSTTAIDPKDSRYGIIAGARYNSGFAFYPSGVTGSKVFMRADAVSNGLSGGETEADYLFFVSDINYGNSSDIILLEQGTSGNANYRACVIDESGVLKYLTGASGSAVSSAYVSGTHTTLYDFTTVGLRWIRFSVSASTTKFYVAPSLTDACHPTTYLINSVSLSTPNVYDKTLDTDMFKVNHGENGIVGYRAIVNDGPLDSSYAGLWG